MSARGIVSRKLRDAANSSRFSSSAVPPRTLLLTGDEHYISKDGKSRTVYKLEGRVTDCNLDLSYSNVAIEETYDIEKAKKKISLVSPVPPKEGSSASDTQVDLFSFDLQEINNGYKTGAGTGSMTWESSVAMSLYFTQNPHELKGNVIELGSGVGMGAILSKVAKELSSYEDNMSVTCTDVNDDVLEMLQHNMDKAAKSPGLFENDNVQIKKLDWFDYGGDGRKPNDEKEQYDTIIASDCAYLPKQVNPLSETIAQLLGEKSKLHMFAPINRTVIYQLTETLKETKHMHVQVENIELSKKRIKEEEYTCDKVQEDSRGTSRFVHITAWHSSCIDQDNMTGERQHKSMSDID